ncbi:MAG: hypothetical protein FWH21_08430 [Kiritimatiellaeota bacterium]|nr:hypothetical protein [Kiritimatiellota bacterium]
MYPPGHWCVGRAPRMKAAASRRTPEVTRHFPLRGASPTHESGGKPPHSRGHAALPPARGEPHA